jgi:hypothetical protein
MDTSQTLRGVRVHLSTGYGRVEGNRRASRNGEVSHPKTDSQLFHRCKVVPGRVAAAFAVSSSSVNLTQVKMQAPTVIMMKFDMPRHTFQPHQVPRHELLTMLQVRDSKDPSQNPTLDRRTLG